MADFNSSNSFGAKKYFGFSCILLLPCRTIQPVVIAISSITEFGNPINPFFIFRSGLHTIIFVQKRSLVNFLQIIYTLCFHVNILWAVILYTCSICVAKCAYKWHLKYLVSQTFLDVQGCDEVIENWESADPIWKYLHGFISVYLKIIQFVIDSLQLLFIPLPIDMLSGSGPKDLPASSYGLFPYDKIPSTL